MTLQEILQQYRVTSPYGKRKNPLPPYESQFHTGIDMVGKEVCDPIESFTEGKIVYSADTHPGTGLGGFGWVVIVQESNGYLHMYAHLQKESLGVEVGDHVKTGDTLGIMGSTGKSTGKHLHYEVRTRMSEKYGYGYNTDPMKYLIDYCKRAWHFYNAQGRKEMCARMHDTANTIRKMIGEECE